MKKLRIKEVILNSNFKHQIGNQGLNFYFNNFSFFILRNFRFNPKTKILSDGQFFTTLINILLRKKYKRNSFDFTSNAPDVFNYISENNKSLCVIGSTTKNSKIFKSFLDNEYNIQNCISIDGFKKNIYEYLLKQDLNNSFIIIGTGSPFQENLATFIYENFKNVEVYTCGGFITQTAESISNKSNHNYYPEFISKFNLRWLYRVLTTNYVLKRVLFYYPVSVIYLIYELIIKRNDNK